MNRNYLAGRRAEWCARQILKGNGFHTVIRAAGSKGPVDLVAVGTDRIVFIQVKRGNRALGKSDRIGLLALKSQLPPLCYVETWRFIPGKSVPEVRSL